MYIQSSPAVGTDGTIYAPSEDGNLYALNPADGSLKWQYDFYNDFGISSPALGTDGTIYIGSTDENLYALNQDGSLKWTYSTGWGIYSSPALGANGTIYIG